MVHHYEKKHVPYGHDLIKLVKREIRRYQKRLDASSERKIVKDYGIDGYISYSQMFYCDDNWEKERVDNMFVETEYIHSMPSMYDCTGQRFTNWFKTVKRNGKWYVYHSIGFDV